MNNIQVNSATKASTVPTATVNCSARTLTLCNASLYLLVRSKCSYSKTRVDSFSWTRPRRFLRNNQVKIGTLVGACTAKGSAGELVISVGPTNGFALAALLLFSLPITLLGMSFLMSLELVVSLFTSPLYPFSLTFEVCHEGKVHACPVKLLS